MMPTSETTTGSAEETRKTAEDLAQELDKLDEQEGRPGWARVIALHGELGSGKTTFVQGFARHYGVKDTVNSPTFLIMKKYPLTGAHRGGSLYHFDLYRLGGEEELLDLGWEELLGEAQSIILVEWPEKAGGILPAERIDVFLHAGAGDERHLAISEN